LTFLLNVKARSLSQQDNEIFQLNYNKVLEKTAGDF